MNIEGRVALVSGGGSGLGAATAEHLVGLGAKVAIFDRDELRSRELLERIGDGVLFARGDVTNDDQVVAALDHAIESFGHLDVLVNCAGIGGSARTVGRDGPHDIADFSRIVAVNLIGTFSVLSQAGYRMANNQPDEHGCRGVIVNTSSIAAFEGQIGQAAYAASKAGIVGMTLPVARDLAALGIRCCTICPGTFDTPLLSRLPPAVKTSLAEAIPNPPRLGIPVEYAMLVEHIIANPYLNGETIRLDGALRMAPK